MFNKELVYPELSYEVMGAAFEVANSLPIGLPEKDYQKALVLILQKRKITFKREVYIPITLENKVISKYFADFVIDGKIILELKVAPMIGYAHARQLLTYLRASNYRLGIILYFTDQGVRYRRVVNDHYRG